MRKLWLLLAVLLPLLPSPAAASERAPDTGGVRYEAAPGHDFGDPVRAGVGFEILTQQTRGAGGPPRDVLPHPEAPRAPGIRPLPPVREGALPAPEGSTPLCEHLPYYATAPPLCGRTFSL